jgi:hypothetical protein
MQLLANLGPGLLVRTVGKHISVLETLELTVCSGLCKSSIHLFVCFLSNRGDIWYGMRP